MLTSKQRAYLRGMANTIEPIAQIGKSGASPEQIHSLDEALEARELIKISVLENCADDARTVADLLGGRTRAEVVQVIGRKIVLFRQSKTKPVIELPKAAKG